MKKPPAAPLTPERIAELIQAQHDLCSNKGYPFFAPGNGVCWSCGQCCVTERWATELATGCPKCARSYVS